MKLETSKGNIHPQEQQRLKVPPLRLPWSLSKAQRETGKAPRRSKALLPVTMGTDQSSGSWFIRGGTAQNTEDCARSPCPEPEDAMKPPEPP